MTDILNRNAFTLYDDRAALDPLIKALALERGCEYPTALESFMRWSSAAGRGATVRAVLRSEQVNLDAVVADVKTLDQAEAAKAAAFAQAAPKDTARVDAFGRVLLDQRANVGAMLHNEVESENRYRAGRKFDERYQGPDGRQAWDADNTIALDAGIDLLATWQRPLTLAAAQAPARKLAHHVDRALQAGDTPQERKMLLDQAVAGHRSEMRLLDRASPGVTDRLHGPLFPVKLLDNGHDDWVSPEARLLDAEIKAELTRRGLDWSEYRTVMHEVMGG
jgi:hypothetical protein